MRPLAAAWAGLALTAAASPADAPRFGFESAGREAGLTATTVFGGQQTNTYLLETTGSGAALLDYDGDGWLDVFVVNGTTLEGFPKGQQPTSHLYRNRQNGTFEDVSARAKVGGAAFSKGATAGDYDKDGYPDLYVSNFMGENFLYHNQGDGTFEDLGPRLGVTRPLASFSTWFFDYDNDTRPDIFVVGFAYSTSEFLKHYLGIPPRAEPLTLYAGQADGTFK